MSRPAASGIALALALLCGCNAARAPGARSASDERSAIAASAHAPLDRDGDALPDERDACPCAAEDRDLFEDEDGCPDLDDDGDLFLDVCDVCPRDPETWNGLDDGDGCPDSSPVRIHVSEIRIVEPIRFARGSATPLPESRPILDLIAALLADYPEIAVLHLIGHADRHERAPERLAARRADAVFDALVALGVEPTRLRVESRGAAEPLDESRSETGRAHNRRVGFELERAPAPPAPPPRPVPTEPTCPEGAPPALPPAC